MVPPAGSGGEESSVRVPSCAATQGGTPLSADRVSLSCHGPLILDSVKEVMRMKKLIPIFLVVLLILPVYVHSGRTDKNGGHYDSSTGEYHYHHGYPAHQHTNGVCPYDFDDKTGQNSGTSSGGGTVSDVERIVISEESKEAENKFDLGKFISGLMMWVVVLLCSLYFLWLFISIAKILVSGIVEFIKRKKRR